MLIGDLGWHGGDTPMTSLFSVNGWEANGKVVALHYSAEGRIFDEVLTFPVDVTITPSVHRLLDVLAVVAGVSYAKAFAPATVRHPHIALTQPADELMRHTYDHGMREFAYSSGLPLTETFTVESSTRNESHDANFTPTPARPLIPFGAGRDSCVVAMALRHLQPTLFTVGDNRYSATIAESLNLPFLKVDRRIDPQLMALNAAGAPNGHVPVTAINSLIGVVLAELTQHNSVVMANEKSASRPTRRVGDIDINHQYSKSETYEHLLRRAVSSTGAHVHYLSVLRDIPDAAIARAFAQKCTSLHPLFMSCNRAMIRDAAHRSDGWCGNCPKCRGVYLSLAPYMTPVMMSHIFGRDLLNDGDQIDGFRALTDDETKPFECVADVDEARQSFAELLHHPQWAQHVVVQACTDVARVSSTTAIASPAGQLFGEEIAAFLEHTI